jgi:hypothetical protein
MIWSMDVEHDVDCQLRCLLELWGDGCEHEWMTWNPYGQATCNEMDCFWCGKFLLFSVLDSYQSTCYFCQLLMVFFWSVTAILVK